jgi:hypothetical protein
VTGEATTHEVDLVELRVGLAGLTAEVGRMRHDLGPLSALPQQLAAVAELQNERLTNAIANHERDIASVRLELDAESGRRRAGDKDQADDLGAVERRLTTRLDELDAWQTWAMRLVIGAVVLAVLGVVLRAG